MLLDTYSICVHNTDINDIDTNGQFYKYVVKVSTIGQINVSGGNIDL